MFSVAHSPKPAAIALHTMPVPKLVSPALRATAKRFPALSLAAWRLSALRAAPPVTAAAAPETPEHDGAAHAGVGGITQLHVFHDTENCRIPGLILNSSPCFSSAVIAAVVRRSLGMAVGEATLINMSDHDIAARVAVRYEWVDADPSVDNGRGDASRLHAQLQAAGAVLVNAGTAKGCVDVYIRTAMLQLREKLVSAPAHVRRSTLVTVITGDFDFAPEVKALTAPFAAVARGRDNLNHAAGPRGAHNSDSAGVQVAVIALLRGNSSSPALLALASRTLGRRLVGSWEAVKADVADLLAVEQAGSTLPQQWAAHGKPPVYSADR